MPNPISNADDIIDSRDIIARLDELEGEREDIAERLGEDDGTPEEGCEARDAEILGELRAWDEENSEELAALKALVDECEGVSDWTHGAALIRRTYWVEYVRDMLNDCGEIPKDLPSYIVIDWEETAGNIEGDYSEVDFDGVTYLVRD